MSEKPSRFEVRQKVAEGRTVLVQRAFDTELKRDVAMKTLRDDHATFPERVAAFSAASKLAARVQHGTMVPVIAARRVGNRIFTISPWVQGLKLMELPRPLDVATVAGVIGQLAEGMAVAHSQGTVLRGLNPRDILLRADGQLLLLDLNKLQEPGQASPLPPPHSKAEVLRYLPMEARSNGLIDGQTDIFCLGALALELLTGVPPTAEGAVDMKPALITALTSAGPVGQLAKLAMTLASPRPDQRPTSVANLPSQMQPMWQAKNFQTAKAAVAAALRGVPGFAAPTPARAPAPPPPPAPAPTPHGAPASFDAFAPRAASPSSPQPGTVSAHGGARAIPAAPARPAAPAPAAPQKQPPRPPPPPMQPVAEEDELQHFFEETTSELERQKVKEALAAEAAVNAPANDPWGLRSQQRFRSLENDISSEGDNSGFAFMNESGKATLGQPPKPTVSRTNSNPPRPITTPVRTPVQPPAAAPRPPRPPPPDESVAEDLDINALFGDKPPR